MRCSIITPTIRKEGLDVVRDSLLKQHHLDWEWLIGSPFDPDIEEAFWIEDDFDGGYWSLNRMYNRLFRECHNDLVISWQDWIWIPPDGLAKFVSAHTAYPDAIISTTGDQYKRCGKFGKPEIKVWTDPRKNTNHGSFYEIFPQDCEWNFCAVPKKAIFDVGGFCEELDFRGYGMDGYQVNERLDLLGYKFFLDQSNESFTIRHGREDFGGEENWNRNNNLSNGEYKKVKQEFIKKKEWPRMKYLK